MSKTTTFIDKVLVRNETYLFSIIQGQFWFALSLSPSQFLHIFSQPDFSVFNTISLECHCDTFITFGARISEWDLVATEIGEIFFEFYCS